MRLCDFPILTFDTYGNPDQLGDGNLGCAATTLFASSQPSDSRGGPRCLRAGGIRLPSSKSRSALRRSFSGYPPHADPELGQRTR